jgi:cytochrome c oxidase assembly protein subunit 11
MMTTIRLCTLSLPSFSSMLRLYHARPCLFRIGLGQNLSPLRSISKPSTFSTSCSIRATQKTSSQSMPSLQEQINHHRNMAYRQRNRSLLMYSVAALIFGIGITYASVPLYRAFCSATGFSGTPMVGLGRFEPAKLFPQYFDRTANAATKRIRVTFNADHSDELPWTFKPSQEEIYVLPGETALAFYKAKNKGTRDLTGIATYNVSPDKVSLYQLTGMNNVLRVSSTDRSLLCQD